MRVCVYVCVHVRVCVYVCVFYLECSLGSYSVSQQKQMPKYILIILGHLLNTNTMTSVGRLSWFVLPRKETMEVQTLQTALLKRKTVFAYLLERLFQVFTNALLNSFNHRIVIVKTESETIWQQQIVITTSSLVTAYIDYLKVSAIHVIKSVSLQTKITIIV